MYEKIAKALVEAQKGFSPALKTSTNPHFKTKYADLGACIEAVIDSLNANGIALIQRSQENANGVTIETVFLHESGETFSGGLLHVPASRLDPQGYGSALTYARRYSLMSACAIAPEDDDGNAGSKAKVKRESVAVTNEADPWTTRTTQMPMETSHDEVAALLGSEDVIPHCNHGEMIRKEGMQKDGVTPYMGYVCPLGSKNPDACPAQWYELSPSGKWRVKEVK